MSQLPQSSYPLLGDDGPFAKQIKNFNSRPVQQQLASAIESAFNNSESLVAEAGTGIGKTFAYLVPIIEADSKCLISTATKTLQEQLYSKDIPIVCSTLNKHPKVALLKGRANYLCVHRLEQSRREGRFSSRKASHDLEMIWRWSSSTATGDLAEVWQLSDDSEIRPAVTSTADNCLSQDCPDYDDCYVLKARQIAMQSQIVVINHHLLCADLALREDGFGELLPDVDQVVIDEAHRLADTVSLFFGKTFSSRQVTDLAADMRKEYATEARDISELLNWAEQLENAVKVCREYFDSDHSRGSWKELNRQPQVIKSLVDLLNIQLDVLKSLEATADHSRGLESCYERLERLCQLLKQIIEDNTSEQVTWFELFTKSFALNQTPIRISDVFREQWQAQGGTWIFTSATLSVAEDLGHFRRLMGLNDANEICLPSPFNYRQQSMLYLPRGLPEPSAQNHTEALMAQVLPILRANKGRAFCLFTSYRALHQAAEWLSVNSQFNLLIQGSAEKTALLERFKQESNSILLATASFWEGVDVQGQSLSCVVIDKLPFAVPSDPVLKARIDAVREQGNNPFNEIQLPAAVMSLKQGAGRLIRDQSDTGVLVVGDQRLISKAYGQSFLRSLPDMYRSRDQAEVVQFIEESQ